MMVVMMGTWRTKGDYEGLAKESSQSSISRKNNLQLVTKLFYNTTAAELQFTQSRGLDK